MKPYNVRVEAPIIRRLMEYHHLDFNKNNLFIFLGIRASLPPVKSPYYFIFQDTKIDSSLVHMYSNYVDFKVFLYGNAIKFRRWTSRPSYILTFDPWVGEEPVIPPDTVFKEVVKSKAYKTSFGHTYTIRPYQAPHEEDFGHRIVTRR